MRPSELAAEQLSPADPGLGSLLDEVVAGFAGVPGVVAVAISGSIAEGAADRFSDLDLECVVEDVTQEAADGVHAVVHRVHAIGDERWVVPNRLLSTVGLDWLRVDVSLVTPAQGCSHHALVVWSQPGVDPARRPAPVFREDAEDLTRRTTRFLRSLGLLVRDIRRGDLRLGCWATEFLIDELVTLMYLQQGIVRGAHKGTYQQLPGEDVHVLQSLPVAQPEPSSIIDAQMTLAGEFLRRSRALSEQWDATWPAEMEEATRQFLHKNLGAALPRSAEPLVTEP